MYYNVLKFPTPPNPAESVAFRRLLFGRTVSPK